MRSLPSAMWSIIGVVYLAVTGTTAYAQNWYTQLVSGYSAGRGIEFSPVRVIEDGNQLHIAWEPLTVTFISNDEFSPAEISVFDFQSSDSTLHSAVTTFPLTTRYVTGAYRFTTDDKATIGLVVVAFLVGASGWSANAQILNVFIKKNNSIKYYEMSTFFNGLDAFYLTDQSTLNIVCLNLVLDQDGAFVVPNVFKLTDFGMIRADIPLQQLRVASFVGRDQRVILDADQVHPNILILGLLDYPSALSR